MFGLSTPTSIVEDIKRVEECTGVGGMGRGEGDEVAANVNTTVSPSITGHVRRSKQNMEGVPLARAGLKGVSIKCLD